MDFITQTQESVEDKIDLEDFKNRFNLIHDPDDENFNYNTRFLHNKFWAEKILKISIILNVISVSLIAFGFVFFVTKPAPYVYGTTPVGDLYLLPTIDHEEAIDVIKNYKNTEQIQEAQKIINSNSNSNSNGNSKEEKK